MIQVERIYFFLCHPLALWPQVLEEILESALHFRLQWGSGHLEGKGRHPNGVGCFHLIITTADIRENQVMRTVRMGTYNVWQGGQILSKCYDEAGGRLNTRLGGEAVWFVFWP